MRTISMAVCALLFVVGCGGKTNPESIAAETMATLKETSELLKTCTDEASAEAAKPKLMALSQKLKSLKKQSEDLGPPSKEQAEAIQKKYGAETVEAFFDVVTEKERVEADPKMKAVLANSLE